MPSAAAAGATAAPLLTPFAARLPRRGFLRRTGAAALAGGLAACAPAFSPAPDDSAPEPADELPLAPPVAEPDLAAPPPPPPAPPAQPRVPIFYRPEYALAGYSFDTTRKAAWVADSFATSPFDTLEVVAPEPLSEDDVTATHDPAYVAAVRTGTPRALAQSQGFTWDSGLFPMVLASNGGAVAAAQAALRTGVAGSLSSGLHHARRARGNGNCTFNGLALAARTLLAQGASRILILDLDAHCGGGTDELVGGNPAVRIVDVAVYAFDVYTPHGQNSLDLVQAARNYLPAILRRLDALDGTAFDICLYNAGMDPAEGCPLGGLAGIGDDVLAAREQLVFDWCRQSNLPIAFVLAGGYVGPNLARDRLVSLHRLTLQAAAQMPVRAAAA